jgi:Flp pilus assembly pilin Flp
MMGKLKEMVASFWKEEDGLGVVESLLILAVIIAIAVIFKEQITGMVNKILGKQSEGVDKILE